MIRLGESDIADSSRAIIDPNAFACSFFVLSVSQYGSLVRPSRSKPEAKAAERAADKESDPAQPQRDRPSGKDKLPARAQAPEMNQGADAENHAGSRAIESFAHGRRQAGAFRSVDPARSGTKRAENGLFAATQTANALKNVVNFSEK
jgi:hypothetical protein